MILAAFLSITFAANLPLAVILTWITNPFTYIPIVYFAIKIGGIFINAEFTYEIKNEQINIFTDLMQYWEPLFLGSFIIFNNKLFIKLYINSDVLEILCNKNLV